MLLAVRVLPSRGKDYFFPIKVKVKFSPLQALEALRVVRG
jgi:hypothetical protein